MYLEQLSPEQRLSLVRNATIGFFPESWRKNIDYVAAPMEFVGPKKDPHADFELVLKSVRFGNGAPLGFVSLTDFDLSFCNNMLRASQKRKTLKTTAIYPPMKFSEETGKVTFDVSPEERQQNKQANGAYQKQMSELFSTYEKECHDCHLSVVKTLLRNGIEAKL